MPFPRDLDRGMLGNDGVVDGVGGNVDLLGGLGRLNTLRGVPRSDRLRTGRGSLEGASGLSRGLGIIIVSDGDIGTTSTYTLIAAIDPSFETGAEIY